MMRIVLANIDYRQHLTDEGHQLQAGLEEAGWRLVGNGFGIPLQDVEQIVERYRPAAVFVSDKRDFDPESPGSFRKDVGFSNLGELGKYVGDGRPYVIGVIKDAGSVRDYHRRFIEEIRADAVVVYYHPEKVLELNPWLGDGSYPQLIRTYHSIDRMVAVSVNGDRRRGAVSGALDPDVYPVRTRVAAAAAQLGLDVIPHPGYHNRGNETAAYMRRLAGYRVHVATASIYGFALRKIIESVAVGATPVTNLPASDVLPEIDGALVRVSLNAGLDEIREAVDRAEREWKIEERSRWADTARDLYDYRTLGKRLNEAIEEAACTR